MCWKSIIIELNKTRRIKGGVHWRWLSMLFCFSPLHSRMKEPVTVPCWLRCLILSVNLHFPLFPRCPLVSAVFKYLWSKWFLFQTCSMGIPQHTSTHTISNPTYGNGPHFDQYVSNGVKRLAIYIYSIFSCPKISHLPILQYSIIICQLYTPLGMPQHTTTYLGICFRNFSLPERSPQMVVKR